MLHLKNTTTAMSANKENISLLTTILLLSFTCLMACMIQSTTAWGRSPKVDLTAQEQAWLANHPNIRLGFNPHMEPLLIKKGDGSYDGIYPAIIKELEQALGISISIEVGDWNPVVQKARSREIDGLLTCTPSQAEVSNLLMTQPLHQAYPVAFTRHDAPFAINSLEDLKGKRIAYQKEVKMLEATLQHIDDNAEIIQVNSTLEALKLVLEGKVDVAFGINFENYLLASHSFSGINLSYLDLEHASPISTCIRNDWPEFVSLLNKGMDAIGRTRIQEILAEWTNVKGQVPTLDLTPAEQSWLAAHRVIRVGADPAWAPIEFINKEGHYSGISIDYIKKIEQMLGVQFEFIREDWQELIALAKQGRVDMFSNISKTPDRASYLLFTNPYIEMPTGIFTRKDAAYILNMNAIANEKIAVVEGYAIHDFLVANHPNFKLILVKTSEEGLRKLVQGKVFAFIDNTITTGRLVSQKYLQVKLAGEAPFVYAQRMGIRKDWPQLRSILQKAIDAIPAAERNNLYNQWVPLTYEKPMNHTLLWQIGFACFVLVALLFVWSIKLKHEVKKRTKDLSQSEELFSKAFHASPDTIAITRLADGLFIDVNEGFEKTFKESRENVIGRTTLDVGLWPEPHDRDRLVQLLDSNGFIHNMEIQLCRLTGELFNGMYSGEIINVNGDDCLVSILHDMTDQELADTERKKLLEQLAQAQKMEAIGTLAGGIAHDFNNILGAIMGYADLAKEDSAPETAVYQYLEKVLIAAHRAKNLVQQILAFSRQAEVKRIPMQIQPLIKEGVKLLRSSIPTTISIIEDIDPSSGVIMADPTHIHQILMNLCTNASHTMEKNGGALSVSLKTTIIQQDNKTMLSHIPTGDYIELVVADTGAGIGPDVIDRIFDPYFTTKEIGKGTGLGLSIIHGIVKSYGGAITVDSQLGKGSTFHVYFPVITKDAQPEMHETMHITGGKERILFVDDEPLLTEMGKNILERLGYHVTVQHSSIAALATFQKEPHEFDLVITDQTMPEMTGADLSQRLMQIRPDIPIILCTGYSNLIDEASAKALGIKEFALKPLSKSVLAKLIRKILDVSV